MKFVDPEEHKEQSVESEVNNKQPLPEVKSEPKNMKDKQNDFFPIENLPSRYKFYPEGTQILGRKSLTVSEVKRLSYINGENANNIVNSIIESATQGMPVKNILNDDKIYIIFWLRANTYCEPGYSVPFTCSHCEASSSYDFELDNIHVNYADDNYQSQLDLSNGDTLTLHPLTIGDKERAEKFAVDLNEKYAQTVKIEDVDFINNALHIGEINSERKMLKDRYNYVKGLNPMLLSQLETVLDENDFGVRNQIEVKCNNCEEVSLVGVPFRKDFFIPKYRIGANKRS